jgi:DNA-binding CsgD family transcriptional regulator
MINESKSYSLFFKFIETYAPIGFRGIDRNDPLIKELEELMEKNKQFLMAADFLQFKIEFTSNRSTQMIGIEPADLNPYHFIEATHPDDILRHNLGRAKNVNIAKDLFIAKGGHAILSSNVRMRNAEGIYNDLLFQCLLFYSEIHKTVLLTEIHTNIDWFKFSKNRFHYYVGDDMSMFRYPDKELLMTGNPLTDREFEIVKLIANGLSSEKIAEQLFLSIHTINTHRSNIVNKTGYNTIAELIIDYQKHGLL